MKFLSARDLHPLFFLGLMLVTATAFPTSQVRRGDLATADTTSNKPVYTTSQQVGGLVTSVLKEVLEMRKELCNGSSDCMNSDDALSENRLNLPVIQMNDGCFETGHNWEICLLKITSGLLEYEIYLEYVKNNMQDSKKDKARAIQTSTQALISILRQEVKEPGKIISPGPTSTALQMETLKPQDEWLRTRITQIILKALEEFLMDTMRSTRKN
ncbi:interleukin-6 [Acomys russatus]|uniref:interleukin-6 n=1 Tax=Acomys russatus TaxID=60746 RepID=UPI0021E1EE6E|nr:interleukin-6 [Acomys russatus]